MLAIFLVLLKEMPKFHPLEKKNSRVAQELEQANMNNRDDNKYPKHMDTLSKTNNLINDTIMEKPNTDNDEDNDPTTSAQVT